MIETTLHSAVQNEKLSSKQGFLQKLFAVWFDAFVYNQIWEDPRVDIEALKLDSNSRVLTISSGGCNALNYLVESPESVTAVDLNRHHIYLLNLKLTALKQLPTFEDFFDFFGYGKGKNCGTDYLRYIAKNLDKDTRNFWESNTLGGSVIYGNRISFFTNAGLYEHSRNGYFLRFFHAVSRLFGCKPDEVLKAMSLAEQGTLYAKHIDPFFDNFVIKTLGKLPITMFGLGIPPQQYDELKKDLSGGKTIIDIYRERVRRLTCDYPIQDNYFAWQAFARKYDTEKRHAVPEYLKQENYDLLKSNADRLVTKVGSVIDEIKNSEKGTFNRFIFLDAQDWMNAETMTDLWSAIAEKAEPGSRIIFRTASAASPIETNLAVALLAKFHYEKELSARLFKQDRASIYGGFHLYELKKLPQSTQRKMRNFSHFPLCALWLIDLMSNAFENMDRMYRLQRYFYDFTRKYYLLGRDQLLEEMGVRTGEKVLEIGCGTARNLIVLAKRHPDAKLYGLDASAAMLETAQSKADSAGANNITLETALADDFSYDKTFDLSEPFDKIFFSYSISMIPPWRESIENAIKNLEPGGRLFIVDFYDQKDLPTVFQKFLKWWLKKFHVQFWDGLIPHLDSLETTGVGKLTITPLFRHYAFILKFDKNTA